MAANNKDLTNIDIDNDWKFYCQQLNDNTDENIIVSTVNNNNTNQCWSSIELPHRNDTLTLNKDSCKWWYRKQFNWTSTNQRIYLNFESSDIHAKKSNINAAIWVNGTHIFSGSLSSWKDPIKLSPKLLHSENKHGNILLICCVNTTLSLHVCLRIRGKVICATGQVMIEENSFDKRKDSDKKQNNVLDYTVSVDDGDGRIDVVFHPKLKSKATPTIIHPSQSIINEKQTNENDENIDEDLLVPRLAIVILIVGTRGDVQPFIA
jgi:hypothetical protein